MEQYGFSPAGDLRLVNGQGLTVEIILKSRTTGIVTDATGLAMVLTVFRFEGRSVVASAPVGAVVAGNARFGLTPAMVGASYAAGQGNALGWQVTSPDGSIVYLAPRGFAVGPAADLSGSGNGGSETWQLTVDPARCLVASITVTGVPGPGAAQQLADLGTIDAPTTQALEAWLRALAAAPPLITADSTTITADDTILSRMAPTERDGIDNVADVVIYGCTLAGIFAAVRLRQAGRRVVIVPGWREMHPGGVVAGGLGYTDLAAHLYSNPFGGIGRRFLRDVCVAAGIGGNITLSMGSDEDAGDDDGETDAPVVAAPLGRVAYFGPTEWVRRRMEPRYAEQVARQYLQQWSIPVYWGGGGIASATKAGGRITSITTMDGQTIRGRYFVEAGYEGDLIAKAGISYTTGRPAASAMSPDEGYRGAANTVHHQFRDDLPIDPFVVPGVPSSGLLPGLSYETETVGQADAHTQAYNFRMIMTVDPSRMVALPSTPPTGYDPAQYELLLRYLAAIDAAGAYPIDPTTHAPAYFNKFLVATASIIKNPAKIYDVNAGGPISTDMVGGNAGYLEASYADRELIWQAHQRWILGYLWTLQHSTDPRVPTPVRAEALRWGFDRLHFTDPCFGDPVNFPYQLYVRQPLLIVGDHVHTEADNAAADGTAPRSPHIVGTASYVMDLHQHQRVAIQNASGVWCVKNEGEVFLPAGATDMVVPLPYEIMLPKRAECANLLSVTALSATPLGYAVPRMEPALWTLGEAAGAALAVALRQGDAAGSDPAVQDLAYADIRAELLASIDRIKPVLPLVN